MPMKGTAMNKLAKGAIAGAAGIALLMGGAGTLAYWNDSADVLSANQQISSGDLTVVPAPAAAVWTVKPWNGTASGTAQTIADISTFKMVPGDLVEYAKSVTVTAVGTTLKLQLTLAPGSITSTSNALSTELASAATMSITGALPTGVTATATPGLYNVVPGTYTLPIKVAINWADAGTNVAASENLAKNQSVTYGAFAVQVKQVFS
jgi:alternate signal-mediated exported protein